MNLPVLSTQQGLLLTGFCATAAAALLAQSLLPLLAEGPLARSFVERSRQLEGQLIFVRAGFSGRTFLFAQGGAVLFGTLLLGIAPAVGAGLLALAFLAPFVLKNARRKRVDLLEKQIEGWLTSVARCLEAAPSLGEALESSIATCDAPMREEVQQIMSEIKLGRPIDKALSKWSERVDSRTLTMAIATLLVGRETGGQIGQVLRSAAASLREMERLEGVVRTKTAEGKGQALVISIVPFPLYLVVRTTDPTFFLPLEQTATGHLLMGVAAALWIAATLSARKILAVQI